jgi:hypothetical protein
MDPMHVHILERLGNLEGELAELREVTWPVCQGLLDKTNPLNNIKQKRKLLRWLDGDLIRELLLTKARFMGLSRDQVSVELRQVLVEEPPRSVS